MIPHLAQILLKETLVTWDRAHIKYAWKTTWSCRVVPQFGTAKLVPISLWFLLVIYRTSFYGIITPLQRVGAPPCKHCGIASTKKRRQGVPGKDHQGHRSMQLVVYLPLWKMMEWKSVGMMTFPIYGKIKAMFQTINQDRFWFSGELKHSNQRAHVVDGGQIRWSCFFNNILH